MVNNDRIVPITNIDFLSMIGTVINLIKNFPADDAFMLYPAPFGKLSIPHYGPSNVGTILACEPVDEVEIASGVEDGVIYFVADYGYKGFSINGTEVTTTGVTVQPDGITLYKAALSGGAVEIAVVTPQIVAS